MQATADQLGLHPRQVTIALAYAAASLGSWAADNPDPGDWPEWLTDVHRS